MRNPCTERATYTLHMEILSSAKLETIIQNKTYRGKIPRQSIMSQSSFKMPLCLFCVDHLLLGTGSVLINGIYTFRDSLGEN